MQFTKKILTSLLACFLSLPVSSLSAITFEEALDSLKSTNSSLPSGVENPKGNIGYILSEMFYGTSDGPAKKGKIKSQYLEMVTGGGVGPWTTSASNAYLTASTGSVGIGTINPSRQLEINADGNIANRGIRLSQPSNSIILDIATSGGGNSFIGTTSNDAFNIFTNNQSRIHVSTSGNIGIGNSAPTDKLSVFGSTRLGAGIDYGSSSVLSVAPGDVSFDAPGIVGGRLKISGSTGNVGIGTVSPSEKLSVYGNISATSGNLHTNRGRIAFSSTANDPNHSIYNNYDNIDGEGSWDGMKMNVYSGLNIRVGNASGVTPTSAMFVTNVGKVGIGTTTPISALESIDNTNWHNGWKHGITSSSNDYPTFRLRSLGTGKVSAIGNNSDGSLYFYVNGSDASTGINALTMFPNGGITAGGSIAAPTFIGTLSGAASSAITADAISSANSHNYTHTNRSDGDVDFNTFIDRSRVGSINATVNSPFGPAWYNLINVRHRGGSGDGNAWGGQLAFGMTNFGNRLAFRNQSSGAWQGWTEVLTNSNYNAYSPTLTGVGASGTWGINITGSAGSVPWSGVTGKSTQGDWVGKNTFVSEMLSWKNYGNGHVLFDASAGTSPSGTAVDRSNSQNAWTSTYPTLMGWNGANTYGVRVDSARVSDSTSSVPWSGVTGKPTTIAGYGITDAQSRWYDGWVANPGYDANTIGPSKSGFSYGNNAAHTGPLVHFDAGGYGLQFSASYSGGGESISFRTRNGDSSTWNAWNQLITPDNYSNYTPTKTGVGASGTWGINITGSAGSVPWSGVTGKPNTLAGYGITDGASTSALNLKADIASPTLTGTPAAPTAALNTNTTQIATTAYVRTQIANDAPTKTGGGASGTWGISISGNAATATTATNANFINAPDGDRNAATKLPTSNPRSVRFDFVGANTANGGGNYSGLMTYAPWDGTSASTGDASYQISFNSPGTNASGVPYLSIRNGINSTWNTWYTMLNSGNYNSYSPTLTGGGASGTWGINVSGTASNVTALAGTWDGINYFRSNKGSTSTVGANNTYGLEAYSTDGGAAGMSFHRAGQYAVNMGLDPDNVLRIGGWSAPANRWQLDMSGNQTVAGTMYQRGGNTVCDSGNNCNVPWANVTSKPTTVAGYGITDFVSSNSSTPVAADVTTTNGHYYVNGNISLFGQTDGALYAQSHSSSWAGQIYQDYRSGQIALRGKNNNTWQSWRAVLDSSNYTSYSPSLTGGGASGTWGISISGNAATATTATNATQLGGIAASSYVTTGSSPTFADTYTNNWFRSNTNLTGLYNQVNGNYLYSEGPNYWTVTSGGQSAGGMMFRQNHNGVLRGYVYHNSSGFGLLNDMGGWSVRANLGSGYGGDLYGTWNASNLTIGSSQVLTAANYTSYIGATTCGGVKDGYIRNVISGQQGTIQQCQNGSWINIGTFQMPSPC